MNWVKPIHLLNSPGKKKLCPSHNTTKNPFVPVIQCMILFHIEVNIEVNASDCGARLRSIFH